MASRREILKWSLGAIASCASGLPSRLVYAEAAEVLAVVVAKSSPIRQLSQFELKKLYLGSNISGPTGDRIIPFNQAPKSLDRVAFDSRVLGMTQDELARYWIDRKIRGQSGAPKAVGSAELVQRVVSRLENSVGYVRLADVLPELRVLSIDGAIPGQAGYKLMA
jgi:ABC-type phosphate transport system substrate-binding protein